VLATRAVVREQRGPDFPDTVHGVPRGTTRREIMSRQSEFSGADADAHLLGPDDGASDACRSGRIR